MGEGGGGAVGAIASVPLFFNPNLKQICKYRVEDFAIIVQFYDFTGVFYAQYTIDLLLVFIVLELLVYLHVQLSKPRHGDLFVGLGLYLSYIERVCFP